MTSAIRKRPKTNLSKPLAQLRSRPRHYGLSRNLVIGGLAGLVLSSFSVLGLLLYFSSTGPNPTEQLEIAMRLMRKGDMESPYRIVKAIDPKTIKKRTDLSKREFLLGATEREQASLIVQRRIANDKHERAVKHLEKSRDLAFPDGYEGLGNYHLGMALFELFRWDEAEAPLEVAAERWPQGRADAIERLVDIDMSFENQDPDSALQRIEHWRSLPRSSEDEVERATIKEMQVHYAKGEYAKAASLRSSIPTQSLFSPNAGLIHGRCMQKLAALSKDLERTERLNTALADFQKVLASANPSVTVRRQCNLEMGRVIKNLGDTSKAVSTFSTLRLSSPYEVEGLVSGLEEIDSLIDLHRVEDAADTLEHITRNFGEMQWYNNDWIPMSDLRKKLVASGERMIDSEDYREAARFSNSLTPLCDELDRLRMQSRLYELWATQESEIQKDKTLARPYYLLAAEAYEKLAVKLMRSPQYDELLWRAIENYRQCEQFKKSNLLLENYLRFESRENQPKGLLAMARNYNALEQPELAMISLNNILASNTNTPLLYDARLEAAKLKTAKDEYDEAEKLLDQNLAFGNLTPTSPIWKESLFLLSDILYRRGQKLNQVAVDSMLRDPKKSYENLSLIESSYKELMRSIDKTKDGLRRFDNDPRRLQLLYRMARSYQMASSWPDLLLRENQVANEDSVTAWRMQRKELLDESRNAYSQLRQEITIARDTTTNPITENLLRNSYFGEADLLFGAGSYDEAIVAYQEAATRFINEPESMEAIVQIANSQKKLGKLGECKRSLEAAKDFLSRIPSDKNPKFKLVTRHDRLGWEIHIDWLLKDLARGL